MNKTNRFSARDERYDNLTAVGQRLRRRFASAGGLLNLPKCLSLLVLIPLLGVATNASAHTVAICWKDDGAVTTFYAGSYHDPSEAPSPVGSIIVDGFAYPFSGYVLAAALPGDVQCFNCTNNSPPAVVHYQTFTSAFAGGTHTINFDATTQVQTPWPGCPFTDQAFAFGGGACADADFDGLCNDVDPCPLDAANDGDGDGLCADVDNCPLVANADQADANSNGQGDVCEGVVCGNSLVTPPEECDDGNIAGGDGCSAICTIESNCGDGALDSGEECDDGNTNDGDCCSSACQYEPVDSACGSSIDNECANPDLCDGAGTCEANDEPAGFVCGDAGIECVAPDTCDGSGACIDNGFAAAGSGCGSSSDTDCDNPDTCNGAGACSTNHEPVNTACTPDANDCSRDLCDGAGACTHPFKPDDSACDDGDLCTTTDACTNGICAGNSTGADSDGDGHCDLQEAQAGCDATDPSEIPPRANVYSGARGNGGGEILMTFYAPVGPTVESATDPSCATAGQCTTGFCSTGRIGDPCEQNSDCNQPAGTCRLVINYALSPDLGFELATLRQFGERATDVSAAFAPATPGCSRKVDIILPGGYRKAYLKLKAKGTTSGRRKTDRDRLRYIE
jgi:cysteine-rich repeat protein